MSKKTEEPIAKRMSDLHCNRCFELEIVDAVSKWIWRSEVTFVHNHRIIQRILFDAENPLVESCRTCRRITKFLSYRRVHFVPSNMQWTHPETHLELTEPEPELVEVEVAEPGLTEMDLMYPEFGKMTLKLREMALELRKRRAQRESSKDLGSPRQPWSTPAEPQPVALRSWDRPAAEIQGHTVYFGLRAPRSFPIARYAEPKWQVDYVQEVDLHPNWPLIRSWLRHCDDTHDKCRPRRYPQLQRIQVVDVECRKIIPLPESEEYLALSYVWGKADQAIPDGTDLPEKLVLTIEDAITAVKSLGYRYLWVDSICIRNAEEKHDQIARMHQIYQGAFATVIVLDTQDANNAIPGISASRTSQQMWARFGENKMLSRLPHLSQRLARSLWATRAWTYQEGLLSHKRIIFTRDQVHLVCNELAWSEDAIYPDDMSQNWSNYEPLVNPIDFIKIRLYTHDAINLYQRLINKYLRRQMTKQEDALHAVTGLLQGMEEAGHEHFHYALPLSNFRNALLWIQDLGDVEGTTKVYRNTVSSAKRRPVASLPSWSCVGWELNRPVKIDPFRTDRYLLPLPPLYFSYAVSESPSKVYKEINPDRWSLFAEPDPSFKTPSYFKIDMHPISFEEETIMPTSKDFPLPAHLQTRGFIFTFPCEVTSSKSRAYGHLHFEFERVFSSTVQKIIPDITLEEDPFGSSPEQGDLSLSKMRAEDEPTVNHEFLWVSSRVPESQFNRYCTKDNVVVEMGLILLFWRDGIAYRGGVVKLTAVWTILKELIRMYTPRYVHFLFG